MRDLKELFSKRNINYSKLTKYGFEKNETADENVYTYKTYLSDKSFQVCIVISDKEKYSKIVDIENDMEYALVDVEDATGEFVGKIKYEYDNLLRDIIDKCTEKDVFKCKQSKDVINYIQNKYGDELEFLWEKFDDNAVVRNKENNKWYAILLTVQENRIRGNSEEKIEVIDLRYQKDSTNEIIDGSKIFPGYHMNKKSWITVVLDNSVDNNKLFELIDNSYNLSNKKWQFIKI